jgi:hypothetical protein
MHPGMAAQQRPRQNSGPARRTEDEGTTGNDVSAASPLGASQAHPPHSARSRKGKVSAPGWSRFLWYYLVGVAPRSLSENKTT